VFNEALKTQGDVKKAHDELYGGANNGDLKNITINNGLIDHDIEERYNFKPIYAASSYIQGLDLTSIQNFEQTFFNDYSLLKQSFKRFKHRTSLGFKVLKELDNQGSSVELFVKALSKTVDSLFNQFRSATKRKFVEQLEVNKQILTQYNDGISDLKKYEVH